MNEDAQTERLAEALDRIVLEGGEIGPEEQDLEPFLALAVDLRRAMPPVQANPAFQASLRSQLLATRRRQVARQPRPVWVYAGALAAAAMLLVAAYLALGQLSPRQTQDLQAQSGVPTVAAVDAPTTPKAPPRIAAGAITPSPKVAPALPVLPPLSASTPRVMIGGLGGGTVGAIGEEPFKQISFELATQLPSFGPTVTVYRYRLPTPSKQEAQSLAARLGFDPTQLRAIESGDEVVAYVISDQDHGSLEIQTLGGVVNYSSPGMGPAMTQNPPPPPGDGEAIKAATQWLSGLQLLPAGAVTTQVELPYPMAPIKEVTFRPAQPTNLTGAYPAITVGILADGRMASLHWSWAEEESSLDYPARTAESAWEMVQSGKAEMHFQGEHGAPNFRGTVRITSVEKDYIMTFALDDRPYLQPIVVFRGESIMAGDANPLPFTARVPLVADSDIAREKVSYLLAGPLPAMPSEGVALQRAPVQPPTADWVRELGRKLGLPGEPELPGKSSPPGMPPTWMMTDAWGQWVLRVSADAKALQGGDLWSFSRAEGLDGSSTPGERAPTGDAAIGIAEEFLNSRSLLTPDLGRARTEPAASDGSRSMVIFQGDLQGLPMQDRGVMTVILNGKGEVVNVISNQHAMEVVKRGRLLTPEQALEAIEAGKGTVQIETLFNRTIYSDRAEIERVELVYRGVAPAPTAASSGPPPVEPSFPRYEPYYLFSGSMEVGESHKRLPFTTSLPALAP